MPIIDIHTHCSPRVRRAIRFGVAEALRGTPVGRNAVTNYRGLPAVVVSRDGRLRPAAGGLRQGRHHRPHHLDAVRGRGDGRGLEIAGARHRQDGQRRDRRASSRASPSNWGLGTLNPLDASHIAEGERCLDALGFKGLLICVELARPLHRRRGCLCVLGMGAGPPGADLHPSAAGADRPRAADGPVQARRAGRPAVRHRHGAGAHDPVRACSTAIRG